MWHKSCHVKFSSQKVQRAISKREREGSSKRSPNVEKRHRHESVMTDACLFCQEENGMFKTTDANDNVKQMAVDLQDVVLLTRMEGGSDLFALILKYHSECLTAIRNHHRSFKRQNKQESSARLDDNKIDARAFVELITHIENCVNDALQNKIIEYFSDAQEQDDGRNKVLVFQPGMRDMLKQAMKCDNEGDALVMAKATKIIRRDIIGSKRFHFNGSFPLGCQQASVPTNLNSLISMLLNGADLKDQSSADSQAALTISQTIIFNCQKRQSTSVISRHSINRNHLYPCILD